MPARTIALLGPSGAGKSTLINALADAAVAATGVVRPTDHKGRHTTTRRELFLLAGGALLLDTPGLRELRVWDLDEGLEQTFPEIEQLAHQCRYRDCRHHSEPGCAVIEALEQAAQDLGLSSDAARKLSVHTFSGAAKLALGSADSPAVLRAKVTSKGGTTERALLALEQTQVKQKIIAAVKQAAERAHELGNEFGQAR